MAKESGEELVGTTDTLESAHELKKHLARFGVRLWLLIMRNSESGKYDVFAANEWCMRLSQEELAGLRNEAKTFIDNTNTISDKENNIVETVTSRQDALNLS